MGFMSVVFMFPTTVDPEVADMNYTVVVFCGTMVLSIVWYYFPKYGGIHWFTGPIANIDSISPGGAGNNIESERESEEIKREKDVKRDGLSEVHSVIE